MRVLIVEDEMRLAKNIAQVFRESGNFAVDISPDGVDGLHMAKTNPYDLIVLDLTLPGIDGLEILGALRGMRNDVPILILTARDKQRDIVTGFNEGGDDYLTKPFDMGELIARCKALIRRSYGQPHPLLEANRLTIGPSLKDKLTTA